MNTLTKSFQTDLRRSDEKFEEGFRIKNARAIASCYTEDAMLLPARTDFIKGLAAIQAFWQSVLDAGIDEVKLDILEAEEHNLTAISTGEYTLSSGEKMADKGKYVVIWRLTNGEWKLHRDIWTTSLGEA